jgi:hypothetical protein
MSKLNIKSDKVIDFSINVVSVATGAAVASKMVDDINDIPEKGFSIGFVGSAVSIITKAALNKGSEILLSAIRDAKAEKEACECREDEMDLEDEFDEDLDAFEDQLEREESAEEAAAQADESPVVPIIENEKDASADEPSEETKTSDENCFSVFKEAPVKEISPATSTEEEKKEV